jgi:periplasmic glucans biosynthesis protein
MFQHFKFIAAALLLALACPARAADFGFDDVARQAAALARQAHRPAPPLPAALAALTYDQYRRIQFREERSLWRATAVPFDMQFFPLGRGFTQPLQLFEVVNGQAQALRVPASDFFDDDVLANGVSGIAGFRVRHAFDGAGKRDEVIAFLGASYFRALGAGQRYGLSARALAVDTVGGRGEEFPAFTSFWFEHPAAGETTLTVYALLDSPRVAGAYRFTLQPGDTTVVDVQARLWLRGPVAMLGIAPLSSMFLAGENQPAQGDYRPEVHDSDGLQVQTASGEWLWRPLHNPRNTFVTSFALQSPRGFGLMQRDRRFASYEDPEAHYEKRPSVWVEPVGDWGAGRVELLQFHTVDETNDNIAAYWVPATLPLPGQPLNLRWRLHWAGDVKPQPPGAVVLQTRRGHGYLKTPAAPGQLQLHVDFAGPPLQGLAADAPVEAVISGNARQLRAHVYANPAGGGWRMTVDVERGSAALELRAFLRLGDRALSETWSYALEPE